VHHFLRSIVAIILVCVNCIVSAQIPTDPNKTGALMAAPPGTLSTLSLPSSTVANTRVGAGDILRVTVFGQPDLSAEVGVNDQGVINLPLIGGVEINQLTTSQIAKKIANTFREKQFLKNPEVSVEVVQLRSQMVSILGEVSQPGRYPIPGQLSVLELLATAGGLTADADNNVIVLRRSPDASNGEIRIPIRLGETTANDRSPLDVNLNNGDVVYVNKKPLFYIHGEVNRPGAYPMEADMNVMRAVSLGGGLSQRASSRRISIYRKTNEQAHQFDAKMTDTIQPGDVIFVKESLF
jgi:polysaccharide export outer membrane protein